MNGHRLPKDVPIGGWRMPLMTFGGICQFFCIVAGWQSQNIL
jgi:hypothetical protein